MGSKIYFGPTADLPKESIQTGREQKLEREDFMLKDSSMILFDRCLFLEYLARNRFQNNFISR